MLFKHFHTSLSRFWVRFWNLHLSLLNFLLHLAYHFGLLESSWIFLILANDPIMLFYVTSSLISHHFHPHTLYSIHTIRNIILGTSHALSRFESLHILFCDTFPFFSSVSSYSSRLDWNITFSRTLFFAGWDGLPRSSYSTLYLC